MKLNILDIENIANLARLKLTESEKARYAEELSAVFGYVEQLNEVDTTGVAETCQVTGLEDICRADEAKSSSPETRQALIEQFPNRTGNLLAVKAVF